ncbi:hypothetical protein GCK32_008817, partial [Trichostrongylus colubriformis]
MVCDCLIDTAGYCLLGFLVLKVLIGLYKILYPYVIATPNDLHSLAGAKWAVVTGSTDGIGK